MIFVTVGSQKFQFDRLVRAVDALIASGATGDGAFAQTGACTYVPEHMEHESFLDRDSFRAHMDACDVVVTHGGTGAIIGAVKDGKKVIAVPRRAEFGEHVDDHQIEIVRQFGDMGLIEPCMDPVDWLPPTRGHYQRITCPIRATRRSSVPTFLNISMKLEVGDESQEAIRGLAEEQSAIHSR